MMYFLFWLLGVFFGMGCLDFLYIGNIDRLGNYAIAQSVVVVLIMVVFIVSMKQKNSAKS